MPRLAAALLFTVTLSAPALAAEAEEVWRARCKNCHGEDGRAQTKAGRKEKIPDFTRPEWQQKHSDEHIREVITEGSKDNPKMKPFKSKLSAEEIDALVRYVRSLGR